MVRFLNIVAARPDRIRIRHTKAAPLGHGQIRQIGSLESHNSRVHAIRGQRVRSRDDHVVMHAACSGSMRPVALHSPTASHNTSHRVGLERRDADEPVALLDRFGNGIHSRRIVARRRFAGDGQLDSLNRS